MQGERYSTCPWMHTHLTFSAFSTAALTEIRQVNREILKWMNSMQMDPQSLHSC